MLSFVSQISFLNLSLLWRSFCQTFTQLNFSHQMDPSQQTPVLRTGPVSELFKVALIGLVLIICYQVSPCLLSHHGGIEKIVITKVKQMPHKMGFTMQVGMCNVVQRCCTLLHALNGKWVTDNYVFICKKKKQSCILLNLDTFSNHMCLSVENITVKQLTHSP